MVALGIILGLFFTLGVRGLKISVDLAVVVGAAEITSILFKSQKSWIIKAVFYFLVLMVFAVSSISLTSGSLAFSIAVILFVITTLLLGQKETPLEQILVSQAQAIMGLFYIGILPSFSYKILNQTQGLEWFAFLLATVFTGDTLAYISGVLIGKHKIMPTISPKKTWQGSIGGLFGSVIAAYVCWHFLFSQQSVFAFLILGALSGLFGQFGDFFESLLKRVVNIKDSGNIMPGHGGILDRIDGILFASPVVLAGILTLTHLLS